MRRGVDGDGTFDKLLAVPVGVLPCGSARIMRFVGVCESYIGKPIGTRAVPQECAWIEVCPERSGLGYSQVEAREMEVGPCWGAVGGQAGGPMRRWEEGPAAKQCPSC